MGRSVLRAPLPVLRDQLRDLLERVRMWPEVDAALDGITDWPGIRRAAEEVLESVEGACNATVEAEVAGALLHTRRRAWIAEAGDWLITSRSQWSLVGGAGDRVAAEIAHRIPLAGNPRFSGRKKALIEAVAVVEAHRGSLAALPAWLAASEAAAGDLLQAAARIDRELVSSRAVRKAAGTRTAVAREAAPLAIQQLREGWGLARTVKRSLPALRTDAVDTYWEGRVAAGGGREPSEGLQEGGTGLQEGGTGLQAGGTGLQEGGTGLQEGGTGLQEAGTGLQEGGMGHPTTLQTHTTTLQTHTTVLQTHPTLLQTHPTLLQTHPTSLQTHPTPLQTGTTLLQTRTAVLQTHPTPLQTFGPPGGPLPQPAGPPAPPNRTPTDGSDP